MAKPELLPNYYVFITAYNKFFKVGDVEPFQYDTGQEATAFFSAVAGASTSSGYKNITELEPDDKPCPRLFQAVVGVDYNMRYYFKIPTGTNRFGTDVTKGIGYIDNHISPYHSPSQNTTMWFVKNYYPAVSATNDASISLTPRLRFEGYKYDIYEVKDSDILEKLQKNLIPYRHISIGGVKCN